MMTKPNNSRVIHAMWTNAATQCRDPAGAAGIGVVQVEESEISHLRFERIKILQTLATIISEEYKVCSVINKLCPLMAEEATNTTISASQQAAETVMLSYFAL